MDAKTNPIKYSDLIQPDSSLTDLIKQLDEVSDAYQNMAKNVREQAGALSLTLGKVSGATEAGRKTIQGAAADADKLAKAQKQLNDAESETNFKLQQLKAAQKEANDIARITAKLNRSAEGSYNKLSAQYSYNKLRLNAMSKEMRENTEVGRKLEQETKAIYEEMKRLQEATGKHQLNVGNYKEAGEAVAAYGEKLKESLGLNSQFGEAILALGRNSNEAKAGIAAITSGFANLGKTLLGLMTNPVFLAIAGVAAAGAAFKWWYDYNSGITEATRLTKQFTDKTGEDLKNFREDIQAIADTFGVDFKETLIAINSLSKQFNISFEESARLVRQGFVAGADANGEFIDTLKEYPAYFKEAGISASDFIAIIAKSTKEGIFSDKGVDAIKEANLRLREMTTATAAALDGIGISSKKVQADLASGATTTWKVMQQVSQKLSELPAASSAVGTAIADIFGGPGEDAGLQYLTMLKDINGGIDEIIANADEMQQAQMESVRATAALKKAVAELFDATGGGFETFAADAKTYFFDVLTGMLTTVNDIKNGIVSAWQTITAHTQTLNKWVEFIWARLTGVLNLFRSIGREKREAQGAAMAGAQAGGTALEGIVPRETTPTKTAATTATTDAKRSRTTSRDTSAKRAEEARRKVEEQYKAEIEAIRKYEDIKTATLEEGYDKRTLIITQKYTREIADLQHKLQTETKLTKVARENITATIVALEKQMQQDIAKVWEDADKDSITRQQKELELRLSTIKKGSAEELKLRLQQIELQQQAEQQANAKLPTGQRVDTSLISAKYETQKRETVAGYIPKGKAKTQTEERARRIMEEQQTITDLIALAESGEVQIGEAQMAALKKRQSALTEEAANLTRDYIREIAAEAQKALDGVNIDWSDPINGTKALQQFFQDMQDAFSGDQLESKIKAVAEGFNLLTSALQQAAEARVQEAEAAVQQAEKDISSAQQALQYEQQARAAGYANNVAMAQKELEQAKKNEAKALRDKKKAQKQAAVIQTVQQIGNLVTASSLIWAQLGFPAAIPAIAVMWGSFAASKIIAATMTKNVTGGSDTETYGDGTVELLQGGSHQSGNDIDLGRKPNGTRRRAEGGEFFAVINRRSSRRYRNVIPDVINSLNDGSFAAKYMQAYNSDGLAINITAGGGELGAMQDDVRRIRENTDTRTYSDATGRVIREYKNLRRISR